MKSWLFISYNSCIPNTKDEPAEKCLCRGHRSELLWSILTFFPLECHICTFSRAETLITPWRTPLIHKALSFPQLSLKPATSERDAKEKRWAIRGTESGAIWALQGSPQVSRSLELQTVDQKRSELHTERRLLMIYVRALSPEDAELLTLKLHLCNVGWRKINNHIKKGYISELVCFILLCPSKFYYCSFITAE